MRQRERQFVSVLLSTKTKGRLYGPSHDYGDVGTPISRELAERKGVGIPAANWRLPSH